MSIFAKVREGFTVVIDDITYEAGAVLRFAEGIFGLHAHKVEVVPADQVEQHTVANDPPADAGATEAGPSGSGASGQAQPAAPAGAVSAGATTTPGNAA